MSGLELTATAENVRLDLYDTTLRDGSQGEGINLMVEEKLEVACALDRLGVDFIEGGWPGANPRDTEFFERAADGELALDSAALVAFGSTRNPRRSVEDDPTIAALMKAQTELVCLVGKSWSYHVRGALGASLDTNLAMVEDSIRYLREHGRRVIFDAEHFFDGYRRDRAYAVEVVTVAATAGAECVVLCDTNGGIMPWDVEAIVRSMVTSLPCDVGLHFHDDGGCAVANSLMGAQAGAVHVQGTANGIGERCGNANLFTILADLQLKRGLSLVDSDRLEQLTTVSRRVAQLCGQPAPRNAPYVGGSAFAHKAGLHVAALARDPHMYQHVDPAEVGNAMRILVSGLAGRATVTMRAERLGLSLPDDAIQDLVDEIKAREHAGWSYEAADASFEVLLLSKAEGVDGPRLELSDLDVTVEGQQLRVAVTLCVGDERRAGVGSGEDLSEGAHAAFVDALVDDWTWMRDLVVSSTAERLLPGDPPATRVLTTVAGDGAQWTTVGVDERAEGATVLALLDAYRYGAALAEGFVRAEDRT